MRKVPLFRSRRQRHVERHWDTVCMLQPQSCACNRVLRAYLISQVMLQTAK